MLDKIIAADGESSGDSERKLDFLDALNIIILIIIIALIVAVAISAVYLFITLRKLKNTTVFAETKNKKEIDLESNSPKNSVKSEAKVIDFDRS